ncbi:hypothetical protein CapIbe_016247 [Capra ibex]
MATIPVKTALGSYMGATAAGGEGFRPWAGEEAGVPGLWSGSGGHQARGQNRGLGWTSGPSAAAEAAPQRPGRRRTDAG